MQRITLSVIVLFICFSSYSATCFSIASGNWNDPTIWSCGVVPSAGDTMIISVGDSVSVTNNHNYNGAPSVLIIDGLLSFDAPGSKLRFACGSTVHISATGAVQSTGVGQASHDIRICGATVWTGGGPRLTGPITFGVPLPVELVRFEAEVQSTIVTCEWETASELNNDYFLLQGSIDGYNWETIEVVDGAGTTTRSMYYEAEFDNAFNQHVFIRLKQVDFNGEFEYSDVLSINTQSIEVKMYPNPTNGGNVQVESGLSGYYNLTVYSLSGQVMLSDVNAQGARYELETNSLNAGIYLVKIVQNGTEVTERLVIR